MWILGYSIVNIKCRKIREINCIYKKKYFNSNSGFLYECRALSTDNGESSSLSRLPIEICLSADYTSNNSSKVQKNKF